MPRTSTPSKPTVASTLNASPRKRTRRRKSRSTSPAEPSASTLLQHSQLTTEQWFKSTRTTKAYANYVKSGKAWLEKWVKEARTDVAGEQPASNQIPEERSAFAGAFDKIGQHTPTALRLLMAYKCDHQGNSFSTAEGLRSAFKDYFERARGCQGECWRYNDHTNKWEGNPVFQVEFKAYFESLKHRDGKTGTSSQALPMLPKDLKIIMTWINGPDAPKQLGETRCLYMKAFMTTAFCLWTRNDELINLRGKDIRLNQVSHTGRPYHSFTLTFRKTNQDRNKSQEYMIPPDPSHPEIDCHVHVSAWLSHLSSQLQRALDANDYIFPAIASTGLLKFGEPTSRSSIESLLDKVVEQSRLMDGRRGRFTTHCFRRGGAQYRFMWADHKFSLKAVKWWGGWSSNENVGTIMRYLLDELMAYEEGFSDILMEDHMSERHEHFMGMQDLTAAVSKGDLEAFGADLLRQVSDLVLKTPRHAEASRTVNNTEPPLPALKLHRRSAHAASHSPPSTPAVHHGPLPTPNATPTRTPIPPVSQQLIPPMLQASTTRGPLAPSLRIPTTRSLDDALRYYERGDPTKGLTIPLQEWYAQFKPSDYRSEAQKLSMIEKVWQEFTVVCEGDMNIFEEEYPGLRYQYTKLVKAVREARILRGETKERGSRSKARN